MRRSPRKDGGTDGLLGDGTRTFTYDTANRLTQVVSGTLTTEYTYAGDGPSLHSGQACAARRR